MAGRLVYLLYNALLPVGLLFALPASLFKMRRRGGYGRHFGQRFGFYTPEVARRLVQPQDFWIHAVSVGEVLVARKLIGRLLRERPGFRITLTTTTTTGYAVACGGAPDALTVLYNPVDLPPVVARAFEIIRPRHLVLIEAEVWPNLVARARCDGVRISLVNARMSDRSAARYRRFRGLVTPVFSHLDEIFVQYAEDVPVWEDLGVLGTRIHHVGSLKYDQEEVSLPPVPTGFLDVLDQLWGSAPRRVLLAASTHPGEEALIARTFKKLQQTYPVLRLLIVPRHFERAAGIVRDLEALGLTVVRRSSDPVTEVTPRGGVYLADTTGELRTWTALADFVVIGKSFLGRGGQNPIEAVAAGKPVLFGSHMQNFRPLVRSLLAVGGAIETPDETALRDALDLLLSDSARGAGLAARAKDVLTAHHGANGRTVERLLSPVNPPFKDTQKVTCKTGGDVQHSQPPSQS